MFVQVVQVHCVTNSQEVERSQCHLFRQEKLKRHQARNKDGGQATPQATGEQRKTEAQLENCATSNVQ